MLESKDVAGHLPLEENGLLGDSVVAQDLGPVRRKGGFVGRVLSRESGHVVGGRVQLLLEENSQILFYDVT